MMKMTSLKETSIHCCDNKAVQWDSETKHTRTASSRAQIFQLGETFSELYAAQIGNVCVTELFSDRLNFSLKKQKANTKKAWK